MGDVLTQSQIDALLNSVAASGNFDNAAPEAASSSESGGGGSSGGGSAVWETASADAEIKYKKYNFHTPKKFTKDRMKLLRSVYENYARLISSYLTSLMRIGCEIELFEIEEQKYYEFSNALGDDSLLAFMQVDLEGSGTEDDPALLVMSNAIMYTMLDRMLGGTGDSLDDAEDQTGGYTDIEMAIYGKILEQITPIMDDVWQNYLNISFKYHKIESNPNLIQVISMDEIVVIVTFNIKVSAAQGQVSLCLPGSILEKVFKQFEQMNMAGNRKRENQTTDERQSIIKGIENSVLEIKAEFEGSVISLEDLYSMNIGDVLNLNIPKDAAININIGNRPWFKGQLGVYKDNVAARLTGIYKQQKINNAGGNDDE